MKLGELKHNVPDSFNKGEAEALLRGDFDKIESFVIWKDTPQGWDFWNAVKELGALYGEAKYAIEEWIKAPRFIDRVEKSAKLPKEVARYGNRSVKAIFCAKTWFPAPEAIEEFAPWYGDEDVFLWYLLNGDIGVGLSLTKDGLAYTLSDPEKTRKQLEKRHELQPF